MFDDENSSDSQPESAKNYRDWIPESALNALMEERETLHPGETDVQATTRIFQEASPMAALAVTHLAIYGKSDSIRLRAATVVFERAMGRVAESSAERENTPLDKMFEKIDGFLADTTPNEDELVDANNTGKPLFDTGTAEEGDK